MPFCCAGDVHRAPLHAGRDAYPQGRVRRDGRDLIPSLVRLSYSSNESTGRCYSTLHRQLWPAVGVFWSQHASLPSLQALRARVNRHEPTTWLSPSSPSASFTAVSCFPRRRHGSIFHPAETPAWACSTALDYNQLPSFARCQSAVADARLSLELWSFCLTI